MSSPLPVGTPLTNLGANHYFTWGTATDARTTAITDELTTPKIVGALRQRNVYASHDENLRLT